MQTELTEVKRLLLELCRTPGVSGHEAPIREKLAELTRDACDEQRTDALGNLICIKRGRRRDARVLLTAHMDQIGLKVRRITKEGYITFVPVGGVNPQTLIGTRVKVLGRVTLRGVIAYKPYHLMTEDERKKIPEVKELFIDVGAESADELKGKVRPGDPIVFDVEPLELSNERIAGPALDNRAGCAALVQLLRELSDREPACDVYVAFTLQEELGVMAAQCVAFDVKPGLAVVVDVTHATEIPSLSERETAEIRLGRGPAIASPPATREEVFSHIVAVAEREKIPYQIEPEVSPRGTETAPIQLVRAGVRTALVSIPLRYMHSTLEVVDARDVYNTARLLAAVLLDESTPRLAQV